MNKKIPYILVYIPFLILLTTSIFLFVQYKTEKEKIENDKKLLTEIKSHYNNYVITNNETKLYKKEKDKYVEYGKINKNVKLELEEEKINLNTKYFYIKDLNLYIEYNKVSPIEEYNKNNRYENYIYFNENIITKENTNFYDNENNYLYTINNSFNFKVLVKDDNRYGVIHNNELLYINKEDINKTYENDNGQANKNKIRTLTYHFIYDPNTTSCTQSICHTLEQFESHLKYIRENDYFTLKLDELELYLDGKINIPDKSIVLTIDDGTTIDLKTLDLLEKYEVNATLFVVTSWVSTENLKSDYLDLESHSDNMHIQYECAGQGNQGGGILCLPEEKVLNDLKLSQDKLNGSKYFAYPFFDFNERAISLLKEAGFKLAFIGQYDSDGDSFPNITDKFKVRRKTIFSTTTMNEFIAYLS